LMARDRNRRPLRPHFVAQAIEISESAEERLIWFLLR
jgi:hypothetical protein